MAVAMGADGWWEGLVTTTLILKVWGGLDDFLGR